MLGGRQQKIFVNEMVAEFNKSCYKIQDKVPNVKGFQLDFITHILEKRLISTMALDETAMTLLVRIEIFYCRTLAYTIVLISFCLAMKYSLIIAQCI